MSRTNRRKLDPTRVAKRRGQWGRIIVSGLQSSGKTRTALTLAFELGNRVLVIDTEQVGPPEEPGGPFQGSSELFAEHFPPFVVYAWEPPFDPAELADMIADQAHSFDVIVVDSLSHFWEAEGGTLSIVDDAAERRRHKGAGWADATPVQNRMVRALQGARCHVVACTRSKKLWDLSGSDMKEIGTAAIQRPGIEYEFNVALELERETHAITITKSRVDAGGTTIPVGASYTLAEHPRLWADLRSWLTSAGGISSAISAEQVEELEGLWARFPEGPERNRVKAEFIAAWGGPPRELTEDQAGPAILWVRDRLASFDPDPKPDPDPEPEPEPKAEPAKPPAAKKATKRPAARKSATKAAPKKRTKAKTPEPPETPQGADTPASEDERLLAVLETAVDEAQVTGKVRVEINKLLAMMANETVDDVIADLTEDDLWPLDGLDAEALSTVHEILQGYAA